MQSPDKQRDKDRILLAHGGGGQLTDELIRELVIPNVNKSMTAELTDSARIDVPEGSICFTTDSYVVKPLFFNGGDIGKLAVCGTVNDLAVAGARPIAISLSLIIEEGFEVRLLKKILSSVGKAAEENNVEVVTGDTKTVEKNAADGVFINTAGIGVCLPEVELAFGKIQPGDEIIINGGIGDHGLALISQREGISFQSQLESDCAGLAGLTCRLLEAVPEIRFMRDPTRGGVAGTLNDIVFETGHSIEINQNALPVNPVAQAAADLLGFDILNVANEGKFIAVVPPDWTGKILQICREHPLGKKSVVIGAVKAASEMPLVEMKTSLGGKRIVRMPYGLELPRIC